MRRGSSITVRFPRNITARQIVAVVRSMIGAVATNPGLLRHESVALEIVGTAQGIIHRLRLPASASTYLSRSCVRL